MVLQTTNGRNTTPALDDSLTARYHLDLATLGIPALVTEDLLIRRRCIVGSRPTQRDLERISGIEARLSREAGR